MPTLNSDSRRAAGLTFLLHAAMLGGLLLTFSQTTTTTAPRMIPIQLVAPEELPTKQAEPARQSLPAPASPAAAPQPHPPAPAPAAKPAIANTGFNPVLLNSAQFNPAIFGNANAAAAAKPAASGQTSAPPVPTPGPNGNGITQWSTGQKRLVSVHRSHAHGYEATIYTFSDGSVITKTSVQDSSLETQPR